MKKKSRFLFIFLSSILVIIIAIIAVANKAQQQINDLMNTDIHFVDLNRLEDGTYRGEVQTIPIEVIVEVIIKNHQILDIILIKHNSGQGKPAESIIENIKTSQSIDVDIISGATYSSKAIMIAIHRALNGNPMD
jgi:uncharacterized protein with FMN-binding domain